MKAIEALEILLEVAGLNDKDYLVDYLDEYDVLCSACDMYDKLNSHKIARDSKGRFIKRG